MLLNGEHPRERRVVGGNELLKPSLSFDERLRSQILPVEPEQVERGVVEPPAGRK
jgi:hypothetical protein